MVYDGGSNTEWNHYSTLIIHFITYIHGIRLIHHPSRGRIHRADYSQEYNMWTKSPEDKQSSPSRVFRRPPCDSCLLVIIVVIVVSVLHVVLGVIPGRTCGWLRGEYMAYSASLTSSPTCFTSYSQTLLHYVAGVGKGMVGFSGSSTTQLGNTLEERSPYLTRSSTLIGIA